MISISRIGTALTVLLSILVAARAGDPLVTRTTWRDLPAFKLTDGKTEAIVVPKLGGRVMSFGLANGVNFLWTGEPGSERRENSQFWGGDKTYIGPHTMWNYTQPRMWPPPAPDVTEHAVEQLPGGRLRTVSPTWEGYCARVTREYSYAADGEFVITHHVDSVPESKVLGAVWVITQTIPSDYVFVPLNPKSPYRDNVFWFGYGSPREKGGATVLSPTLLQIRPITGAMFKLGASPAHPALITVKGGVAFVQRADPQTGQYPEGADGAGMSVEVYHHDLPGPGEYTELELLSPLRRLDHGGTLTTRWRVQTLAGPEENPRAAVEELLAP